MHKYILAITGDEDITSDNFDELLNILIGYAKDTDSLQVINTEQAYYILRAATGERRATLCLSKFENIVPR